jgi:hypothetical protein
MIGFKMGMISAALFLVLCATMPAVAEEKSNQGEDLLSTINRMETMLLRPCDHVQKLMEGLIKNGMLYLETEKSRADHYEKAQQLYTNRLRDFVVVKDKEGKATPGKYIKEYIDIRQKAAEAGILLEEERPGVGLTKLAQQKDASRWFYFADLGSADAENKKKLRYKLEEEYEALVGKWNKARDEFLGTFDKGDFQQYNDFFVKKAAELADLSKKYRDDKGELTTLASSGDYEHCLGEVKLAQYTVVAEGERGILGALYNKGEEGDVNSLPGMGYNLVPSKQYDPLKKPEIGEFPLGLQFKFNGNDYLKLEKELLEIRAQAAETYVFGTSGATGRTVQFFFDTTYKTAEALAAPVQLAQQAFVHPVDTISGIANGIASIPEKLDKITIQDVNNKLNELTWGTTEKLALGQLETLKNTFAPGRFDEKPGETLQQSIDRLNGKLKSLEILKSASDIESSAASIVIQALLDKGITKGLGKFDDVMKGMKAETKANTLLKQAEALKKEQKLLGVAETPDLDAKIAKLKKAADEQVAINKQVEAFVTGDKPLKPVAKPEKFEVGTKIGSGANNTVYLDKANDGFVIRSSNKSFPTEEALKGSYVNDEYARHVFEKELQSPNIRMAKRESVTIKQVENGGYINVERVEKVEGVQIKAGQSMTKGQQLALEQAQRDLNNAGFVWTDNKPDNFFFEKLPGGDDRYRLVVVDPAGIYPVKGKNSDLAKALQDAMLKTDKQGPSNAFEGLFKLDENFTQMKNAKNLDFDGGPFDIIDKDALKQFDPAFKVADSDNWTPAWTPKGDRLSAVDPDIVGVLGDDKKLAEMASSYNDLQLKGTPEYNNLIEKRNAGVDKLKNMAEELKSDMDTTAKQLADGPKAPPSTGKPTGLDPDTTAKELLIAKEVAKGIDKETCASYRKTLLGGVVSEQIKAKVKECEQQGF